MIRKISHIALIFILLVSTTGLTINLHYCNDRIYDLSIYSEATSCCIDGAHEHHRNDNQHHECSLENHMSDCKDKTVNVEPLHDFDRTVNSFNINIEYFSNLFIVYALVSDELNLSNITSEEIPYFNISPPKQQIVLALLQSYLL